MKKLLKTHKIELRIAYCDMGDEKGKIPSHITANTYIEKENGL